MPKSTQRFGILRDLSDSLLGVESSVCVIGFTYWKNGSLGVKDRGQINRRSPINQFDLRHSFFFFSRCPSVLASQAASPAPIPPHSSQRSTSRLTLGPAKTSLAQCHALDPLKFLGNFNLFG